MIDLNQINEISKCGLTLCNDFLSLTCAWNVGDMNYIISQLALMDVLEITNTIERDSKND